MSAGNPNTQGNKKNNHSFQHRNLLLLGQLKSISQGLATEATLISVLAAIRAHQDMEILLVRDEGNNDLVVQQIREYDEETGTWLPPYYQKVDGSVYQAPELVGPLVYLDADGVLNLILAELLDQGLTLDNIETNTNDVATETTLSSLLTAFNAEDFASETTLASLLTAFNAEDFATETTLALIQALLTAIDADTSNLDVPLSTRASEATLQAAATDINDIEVLLTPAVRTHNTVVATVAGNVPAGSISGSVFNSGNQPAGWNGAIIPAGVSVPWGPVGNRDTYGAIPYDPTISGPGTTLIIEYTT